MAVFETKGFGCVLDNTRSMFINIPYPTTKYIKEDMMPSGSVVNAVNDLSQRIGNDIGKLELENLTPEFIMAIIRPYIKRQWWPFIKFKIGTRHVDDYNLQIWLETYNNYVRFIRIQFHYPSEPLKTWWMYTRKRLKKDYPNNQKKKGNNDDIH